jgi:hypothetical protein
MEQMDFVPLVIEALKTSGATFGTWVDGLNIEGNNKAYIANDSFASDTFTSPYILEGTLSSTNGFVTNILFPEFLATAVGGASTSHLHDELLSK